MAADDATLQELIVRALTGRDAGAKQSLDAAAAHDSDLRGFCDELQAVVTLLSGATAWRDAGPSAEMTARIREAVVSKLPQAPPHFKRVLMEADLGRRKALFRLALFAGAAILLALGGLYYGYTLQRGIERLSLQGEVVTEMKRGAASLDKWEPASTANNAAWTVSGDGVQPPSEAGSLFLKGQVPANAAAAAEYELSLPESDEKSTRSVAVFIAESANGKPVLDATGHPQDALELELSGGGYAVYGPGGQPLKTGKMSGTGARLMRARIEHLGRYARVLLNGDVLYEGALPRPARAALRTGIRASGAGTSGVRFNAARLER